MALTFESDRETLRLSYHPETVASDITQLLCRIVTFTPQHQSVKLKATLINERDAFYLKLVVENTGVNLSRIGEITKATRNPVIRCQFPICGNLHHRKQENRESLARCRPNDFDGTVGD